MEAARTGFEDIKLEKSEEGIAKITINRPEVRNAFRPRTVKEMMAAFSDCRDDENVGVVILTGEGPDAFCSGGDQRVRGHGGYVGEDGIPRLNVLDLQRQIRSLPKPVVAMVAGYAVGGGHVLHLVCDLTIAADNARFGQTGPKVGSFDGGLGAGYLARVVGQKKAREIWFLCRQYDAKAALDMGLVNRVGPLAELESETVTWCREMLQHSPRPRSASSRRRSTPTAMVSSVSRSFAGNATPFYLNRRGQGRVATSTSRSASRTTSASLPGLERRREMAVVEISPNADAVSPSITPRSARAWLLACRPVTLTAAVVPVLVGAAVASTVGAIRALPVLAALAGAILIQIATNFANDVFDHEKGADTADRLGPTRATQSGLLSPRHVRGGLLFVVVMAVIVGGYLATACGWPIIAIGVASIAAGIAYTGGPYPLGYHGLGDVFVFLFFGFVAVLGTSFVAVGAVPTAAWVAALPVGALATAILVVNNVRDRATDVVAGKRTLAVRFGRTAAIGEYVAAMILAFAAPVALAALRGSVWPLLPLVTAPVAMKLVASLRAKEGRALNPVLASTAKLLLAHGVLLAIGLALSGGAR